MTNEEAIKILEDTAFLAYQNASLDEINEAVGMAVEALKAQLSKEDATFDCISRADAIDAAKHAWAKGLEPSQYIEELPSVQPVAKDINVSCKDAEIQKMQDMEQAEIEKAFELGRESEKLEIVRCKDCRWQKDQSGSTAWLPCRALITPDDFYCGRAERRTDG